MLKNYFKSYLYLFSLLLILTIFISLLNYLFEKNFTIIKLIIPAISILVASIILGKKVKEKAYLEGLKFSLFFIIIAIIFNLIFIKSFNYKTIIMYFLLVITSLIGSMIGINLKKNNSWLFFFIRHDELW